MEYIAKPWWRIVWQPAKTLRSELIFDPYRGLLKWGGLLGVVYTLLVALIILDQDGIGDNIFFLIVNGGYGEVDVGEVISIFLVSWPFGLVVGICLLYIHSYFLFWIAGIFDADSAFEQLKQIIGWSYYIQFISIIVIASLLLMMFIVVPPPRNNELGIMIVRLAILFFLVAPLTWCWAVQWLGIRAITSIKRGTALAVVAIPNLLIASPLLALIIFFLAGAAP